MISDNMPTIIVFYTEELVMYLRICEGHHSRFAFNTGLRRFINTSLMFNAQESHFKHNYIKSNSFVVKI